MNVHLKNIIHGNLKPENVVLNFEGKPLLTDYGFSEKLLFF